MFSQFLNKLTVVIYSKIEISYEICSQPIWPIREKKFLNKFIINTVF